MLNVIKQQIKKLPLVNKWVYLNKLYKYYNNENSKDEKNIFILNNYRRVKIVNRKKNKGLQIRKVIDDVGIVPVRNFQFYYAIDPFTTVVMTNPVLDNYSIDYSWVVNSNFNEILSESKLNSIINNYKLIVESLKIYINRLKKNNKIHEEYKLNILEIESLFNRPAEHFHEALQRILFVNQWLWQTGHKHNGFGHLDWILFGLYKKDIKEGVITKEIAKSYLVDFFEILHENCWFKSTMLLGDTGQIIILGGKGKDGAYRCNELTYLFIEVSKELKLPDPKVLLRVSSTIPDDLLTLAMECIATGIGAPFLSNDEQVVPALIQFGYDEDDAYNYVTSACWEPLVVGNSCDQNNIRTINFCKPFVDFVDSSEFDSCSSITEVKEGYYKYLKKYINQFLLELDNVSFEEDPLLTLFSPEILKTGQDIVRGGAKYAHLGVTSVGLSSVVNSILALEEVVFDEKKYTISEINKIRKNDFCGYEEVRKVLDGSTYTFGKDDNSVVELTNELLVRISKEFRKHQTKLGGDYKFGLSSPNYIVDARNISATFDGRRAGAPFGTHISGKNGLAPTELISFAAMLDYSDNRINGNVIDFMMTPEFINNNMGKAVAMIKSGIKKGFYQLQINVVDSKILIEAQQYPDRFSDLVVRVWGFSAYFKDLPKSYQDNLIKRALEAEMTS